MTAPTATAPAPTSAAPASGRMRASEVRRTRAVAGVVFAVAGTAFCGESLALWTVDVVLLWPLSLIAIGVSFIIGRARRHEIDEDRAAKLAVAEERVRIARELHDIVAHGVSLMTIQIAAARRASPKNPGAADQALSNAEDAGRQSLDQLRSLLAVLRGADLSLEAAATVGVSSAPLERSGLSSEDAPTAPLPRLADIPALVEALREAGLDVAMAESGVRPARLSAGLELAVYRVVQEALTNVVRHAPRDARVTVTIDQRPHAIELTVEDDGGGQMTRRSSDGHGLVGMRERVGAFGGTVEAGPRTSGPGWRVHAQLPVAAAP